MIGLRKPQYLTGLHAMLDNDVCGDGAVKCAYVLF